MKDALLAVFVGTAMTVVSLASHASAHAQPREQHLYVSVVDEAELPIQGLDENDFVVLEDGQPRDILRATPAVEPLQIDLLLDTSTGARQVIGDMRRAVESFVAELADQHQVSLIGFGGSRFVILEATSNREELIDSLSRLSARPDDASYLVNALLDSVEGFEERGTRRPVAVIVTTTGIDFSDQDVQSIVTRLRLRGAVVHAVVMRTSRRDVRFTDSQWGFGVGPSAASESRDMLLDIGPEQTGGQRIELAATNALPRTLARLASALSNQYRVVYRSPETSEPVRTVQIAVTRGATVRAVPARPPSAPR